jgi:hypothetical protein
MGEFDWVEIRQWGSDRPVRREPTTSAYWYAIGVVRQRHRLAWNDPLPPGVYMLDSGEGALVLDVDDAGGITFGFDAACPPTAEWAGTPAGSEESPGDR